MNTTLLIPSDDLKKYGLITDNVDVSYINPCIIQAQDIDLQQLIGTRLYKRLLEEVEQRETEENYTIPEPYSILISEYIEPYLMQMVQSIMCITGFAQIRNNGMSVPTGEHDDKASLSECQYLKNYFEGKAKFYSERIITYLKANSNLYPEFCGCDTCADLKPHDTSTYQCGIVL